MPTNLADTEQQKQGLSQQVASRKNHKIESIECGMLRRVEKWKMDRSGDNALLLWDATTYKPVFAHREFQSR